MTNHINGASNTILLTFSAMYFIDLNVTAKTLMQLYLPFTRSNFILLHAQKPAFLAPFVKETFQPLLFTIDLS